MSVYFLDSSALVKRYVAEIGSGWVVSLCNPTLKMMYLLLLLLL